MEKLIRIFLSPEFIKFFIIGGSNTLLSYLFFLLFYAWGFPYLIALLLVSLITIPNAYLWQRRWVFRSRNHIKCEFLKFLLVYISIFFLNLILLSAFVEGFGLDPRFAEFWSIVICVIVTFLAQKFWSFRCRTI